MADLTAIAFSGGLGLAAYHAGVYEAFEGAGLRADWLTGSSAGAVTAALIAGNADHARMDRLRAFWFNADRYHAAPASGQALGWISAIGAHLVGSPGMFSPRLQSFDPYAFVSVYDLAPMRARLETMIDFGRLNSGETRVCIGTTDIASGDAVVFDTARERIGIDHVMASCGFLPEFAPVNIQGRWLGDGGLSLNAPFDPVLESDHHKRLRLFVVDLFARDGTRPRSYAHAAERKNDLMLGNQTFQRLRDKMLIRRLSGAASGSPAQADVTMLSYLAGCDEAGPEKSFDFSGKAIASRWKEGFLDMQHAIASAMPDHDGVWTVRRNPASP